MKPKAIISLLWDNQLGALRQFLAMFDPMVIVTTSSGMTPALLNLAADCGCAVVGLESLLPDGYNAVGEASPSLAALSAHLSALNWSEEFADEDNTEQLAGLIKERLGLELPMSVQLLDGLAAAAEEFDVSLFVTSEDMTRLGKVATAWAKAHGIPSLHLSHAIPLVDPYTVHAELIADKMAVYGERGKEGFLDLGIEPERLVLTGNPAWDCYAQLRIQKTAYRQALVEKYEMDPNLPIVVFGTTWAANLSAHCNEHAYADTMLAFLSACEALSQHGCKINAVIKDRPANQAIGERCCSELLAALGSDGRQYYYAMEDTSAFAVAADVLVAVDSNYLVEGMMADTPVINLMNSAGMLMGPCFEAETGIKEVEAHELAACILQLLEDKDERNAQLHQARQRLVYYHHGGVDGLAAARVAQLMASMAQGLQVRPQRLVWQQYLDNEHTDLTAGYHTTGRKDLISLFSNQPSLALDIGCAGGGNGALIKQRFPSCQVWGIEMNHAAAEMASRQLDKVLLGKFEDFDLVAEGMAAGSLDAVVLADVLEHMYNPWDVMVKIHRYLSPQGQVLLSVPNVRNLALMDDLAKGNWTYAKEGLLDITHIRFFTLRELLKFCQETGYKVVNKMNALDGRLQDIFNRAQGSLPCNIETERMVIKNVTHDEMLEMCSLQFYLLLEKA